MELILLERVAKLGQMGDLVNVKAGFARNYLLPSGKALRATEENRKVFEERRKELEARNLEARKEAEAVGAELAGREFVLIRTASGVGSLYGSVTARDIWQVAGEDGVQLQRQQIQLMRPIKEIGMHDVTVILHPEVDVTVRVNVARSEQEAILQSQGRSIVSDDDEDDEQEDADQVMTDGGGQTEQADAMSEEVPAS